MISIRQNRERSHMIYRLAFVVTSLLAIGTFDVFAQTSAGFGFPTLPPCGEGETSQICRVTGTWDAAELIQRYEQEGSSLWGDEADETLTFFYQGDADQVVLCCGIQDSMFH